MTVTKEMMDYLGRLESALEKAASRPAGNAASVVFGGDPNSGFSQHGRDQWPIEQLKSYGGTYAAIADMEAMAYDVGGRRRYSGMGPALVKLAAVQGHKLAIEECKSNGNWSDGYGDEQLDREFGFITPHRAKELGVRIYDRRTKKLTNERRKATALAENSGQTGGYIVPPQFMTELLTIAAEDGFIENRAKVLPMMSRTAQWPMLDITTVQAAGVTPYAGGIVANWQPEAALITQTAPLFRQSTWTAWDLVMYTVTSNQLLADNGVGLDALITQLFGMACVWYKEFAFLQGKGTGSTMPLGILNSPATIKQSRTVASRFTLADAANMLSHLQVRSRKNACWIMHQSVVPQLIQMASGAVSNTASTTYIPGNSLVWTTSLGNNEVGPMAMKLPDAFLDGMPLFITEKLPQLGTYGDVVLADFSNYVIGNRLDMQIDVSPHILFQNNQLAWRVVARCDGSPWLNSFVTDQSGWQVSPFVALN